MRHPHQVAALQRALQAIEAKQSLLIVSPTGSGKSYVCLDILTSVPGMYLVVPNTEIGSGIYHKMTGIEDAKQEELEANRIWTQKRLYNELMKGNVVLPSSLCFDEAHHSVDSTHVLISEACGNPPTIGLTATCFRGTPKETGKLRAAWPNVYRALTLKDAIEKGVISRPDFKVWPLLNDDTIDISNGEFIVSSIDGALSKVLPDIIDRVRQFYNFDTRKWSRPLMLRVSSVASADMVHAAMKEQGLPAVAVTGSTKNRQDAFNSVILTQTHALIHIRVVGEGVDLPIRTMIDLAPTTSPLLWTQAVGRITRPVGGRCEACGLVTPRPYEASGLTAIQHCPSCVTGVLRKDDPPLYITVTHNLDRHSYIFEGLIPVSQIRDAQKAWGPEYKPSRRALARILGFEGFGRFTVSQIPLLDGTAANLYSLQTKDGLSQFSVLLHSCLPEAYYFTRTNVLTGETGTTPEGWLYSKKQYGRWKRIDAIPDCEGYTSVKPTPITDKMQKWWSRSAASVGLHPAHVPNAREFTALPILIDSRLRFPTGDSNAS